MTSSASEPTGSAGPPFTSLLLGMVEGEWPVRAFTEECHAMNWLRRAGGTRTRLWRVSIHDPVELRLVEPLPYLQEQR